jgi:hypothetical protein
MTISAEQISKLEEGLSKPNVESMKHDVHEWQNSPPYNSLANVVILSFMTGDLPVILASIGAALHHGYTLGYAAAQSESLDRMMEDGE